MTLRCYSCGTVLRSSQETPSDLIPFCRLCRRDLPHAAAREASCARLQCRDGVHVMQCPAGAA